MVAAGMEDGRCHHPIISSSPPTVNLPTPSSSLSLILSFLVLIIIVIPVLDLVLLNLDHHLQPCPCPHSLHHLPTADGWVGYNNLFQEKTTNKIRCIYWAVLSDSQISFKVQIFHSPLVEHKIRGAPPPDFKLNKLAKLGNAIAISKSETITDRGNC